MKKDFFKLITFTLLAFTIVPGWSLANGNLPTNTNSEEIIKVAVIGGMTMTGMWQKVAEMFETKTGIRVEIVATGPRSEIEKPFKQGKADLLTMHSGDITTDLVADGYAINMIPWTHNSTVIIGPSEDPAGIKGLKSGAEALKKIAATKSKYLDMWGIGKREISQKMWKKAGIFPPEGDWVIKEKRRSIEEILICLSEQKAYSFFGRIPILFEKREFSGLEIMVQDDPDMLRPYIVMLANPKAFPNVNFEGAKKLQDFLLSKEVQDFLGKYRADEFGGIPLFYPLRNKALEENKIKNNRMERGRN
ncbi:MAG: substrate-binding domain-containing protein [Deltaproteobacteria bacterium]|nr:substrate-binding domain-containing protein [Deltaproteobacteria bacterium]